MATLALGGKPEMEALLAAIVVASMTMRNDVTGVLLPPGVKNCDIRVLAWD